MATELWRELSELLLVSTAALLLIAALRKPVRTRFGARAAYALWLALPLAALATVLPAPAAPVVTTSAPGNMASTGNTGVGIAPVTTVDPSLWLFLWLGGVALTLMWTFLQQRRFQRELGDLQPAADGSHRSRHAAAPALVGLLRPRIVLPSDFEQRYSPGEQALVLAHERSHLRHFDAWANAIAALALCLLWFHPLAWWALGRFRFDQELACDARVLDAAPQSRRVYADALLKTQLHADAAWRLPLGCHWQSSHPLTERVAMLKAASLNRPRRVAGITAVLVLCCVGAFAAWASQPGTPAAVASAKQYSLEFRIRLDNRLTAQPSVHIASGETFGIKVEEDGLALSAEMSVTEQADGSLLLDAELHRNGKVIGKPKLKFLPETGARIEISDSPGEMLEMDVTAKAVPAPQEQPEGIDVTFHTVDSAKKTWVQPFLESATLTRPAPALKDLDGGTVVLRVLVHPDGSASDISVEESSGNEVLDRTFVEAAASWRFNPGVKNGKPIGGWVLVPITYSPDEDHPEPTQSSKS